MCETEKAVREVKNWARNGQTAAKEKLKKTVSCCRSYTTAKLKTLPRYKTLNYSSKVSSWQRVYNTAGVKDVPHKEKVNTQTESKPCLLH